MREGVEVKLLTQSGEVYVLAQSRDRINKERGMRRRQLKWLWKRLQELKAMELKRDTLLMRLGAARQHAPSAWRFVEVQLPTAKKKNKRQNTKDKKEQAKAEPSTQEKEFFVFSSLTKIKVLSLTRRQQRGHAIQASYFLQK